MTYVVRFALALTLTVCLGGPVVLAQGGSVRALSVSGGTVYALVDAHDLYRSGDGGETWATVTTPGDGVTLTDVDVTPTGALLLPRLVVCTNTQCASQLYRSADGGATWMGASLLVDELDTADGIGTLATFHGHAQNGYAGQVIRSTDGGTLWSGVPGTGAIQAVLGTAVAPGRAAFLTLDWPAAPGPAVSAVYQTADGGASWVRTLTTGGPAGAGSVAVDALADGALYAGEGTQTYRLVAGASTWASGGVLPAGSEVTVLAHTPDGALYAGTTSGVFVSTSAGATWASDGLAGVRVNDLVWTNTGRLLAATDRGVWHRSMDGTWGGGFIATASEPVAGALALRLGVAPNPAVGAAEVTLALLSAAATRVAVYDALGREVAVLQDGALAAGGHRFAWPAGGLAPGVYVVRADVAGPVGGAEVRVARVVVGG